MPNGYYFFPGDYVRDTLHLGWLEDLAYRRLIDLYYSIGRPLRNDRGYLMRAVRASEPEQQAAVDVVLSEFFELRADGWHQQKCDERLVSEKARVEAGRRGGLATQRKIKDLVSSQAKAGLKPGPTPFPSLPFPIEERSKTLSANADGARKGFDVFWETYPRKTAKKAAARAWAKVKPDEVPTLLAAVEKWKASDQWRRGIIPHPATFLNGRRWEDELDAATVGLDLGQCMWNHSGERGSIPRCPRAGIEERNGLVYCGDHKHLHLERVR